MSHSDLLNQAEAHLAGGRFDEALHHFSSAAGAGGNSFGSRLGIARVRLARGEVKEAIRLLETLIQERPAAAEPLTYRGVAEERAGALEKALEYHQRAVEKDPSAGVAHFNLGRVRAQRKDWAGAIEALQAAVRIQANPGYLYVLGSALHRAKRTGDAIEVLAAAIARDPDFADAYGTLADVLVAAGQEEAADQLLSQAAARFPDSGIFHAKRAAIAVRRQDLRTAIRCLQDQVEAEPDDQKAWLNLAAFQLMAMDVEHAEQSLRRVLDLNPKSGEAHYQLGVIFDACRLKDEAKRSFNSAIEHQPELWKPYNNLGILLLEDKDPSAAKEAIRILEEGVSLAPPEERVRPLYNLALAYLKAGRRKDAEKAAREVAAAGPEDDLAAETQRFLLNFAPRT